MLPRVASNSSVANDAPADRRRLTTSRIVFVIIAAAAPMAAMVGNTPLALLYGNGPGLPAAYLIAAVVLLCFCVGYAAMGRRVVNTGAFYTYVARGLGKPAGVGAAYLAVVSYTALTIGLAGAFGYFVNQVLADPTVGINLPWEWPAAIAIVLVAILGYRSADLSAKILGVLMVLEFAVLIVFDLAVLFTKGIHALPAESFAPHNIFTGSIGIGLMFAFTSFVGFESGALYGEETARPEKSVPRATYIAVASIGVFYLLTTWFTVGAIGPDKTTSTAEALLPKDLGKLLFNQATTYAGTWLTDIMGVLLCTSVLASMLAVHNASSRYLFALGRERVLPGGLGRYHGRHLSPHVGSLTISCVTAAVIASFAIGGLDPYLTLAASMVGLSTLGVVLLQVLAAASIVAFFRKRGERDYWRTLIFPVIGAVGLAIAFVLAFKYFPTLVQTKNQVITRLPWLLLAVVVIGLIAGFVMKRTRPAVYGQLAQSVLRARPRTLPRPETYGRYCLIGAGPAGLVMARALRSEGIPFDWYEKAPAVGGIWNPDTTGSPMYESAHFISSRYMSGFVGYPMPSSLPDYPSWRQVRDYIHAFADDSGLTPLVTLNTAVTAAVPVGDGSWNVTLSTGATHHYAGVIAAPGVNWNPNLPAWPGADLFTGEIRHSVTYSSPEEFRGKRVLVVGAGNSGVDIACDAATTADAAFLSVRRGYRFVPKHIAGVPTDALLAGKLMPPQGVTIPTDHTKFLDGMTGDLTRYGLPKPDHDLLASHPILNTQVLHHLAHGDLAARADVAAFDESGVIFADGRREDVDVVLLATGYTYALPFLDESLLTWRGGRPSLYLNIFDRAHPGLAVLGFVEFADAAYARFEEMAHLIVLDIVLRSVGGPLADRWAQAKATDDPDLRGGKVYVDSPRHANYVDAETYQAVLADVRDRYGFGEPVAAHGHVSQPAPSHTSPVLVDDSHDSVAVG
jgi:cation diffusion facilitator CzcD-associated flavoprotein CzcO/amino acid transporter